MRVFIRFTLCLLFVPGANDIEGVSVSVMEGDSVTLYTDVTINQQDRIRWYYNDTRIAQITGDQSKICTDDQCDERFRDRLKLDHQTGSLTIMNTRNTDEGDYKLQIIINKRIVQKIFNVAVGGVPGVEIDKVKMKSVKEGESVTLGFSVIKQNDALKWYFNDILIAEITGDQSKICTDDQCDERFRDRLKLDHQTGSLTITKINTTDAGLYKLQINSGIHFHHSITSIRRFSVTVTGASGVETDGVSVFVMEGDSVTLHTDIEMNQQDRMKWYFNDIRIAQITGDQSKICTDDQCDERFRDRLKLDHQTGSLTIMNTRITDSGEYKLLMIRRRIIQKIFSVAVGDVPAAERDKIKKISVKEGESVTLDSGEIKNPNYWMTWYFDEIIIAKITLKPNKTCTDVQCENGDERFRDRLKLDHQTGSLTIMNITNTDEGLYKLQIVHSILLRHSISITSIKRFSITVIDSSLPLGLILGIICAAAVCVFVLVTAAVICLKNRRRRKKKRKPKNTDVILDLLP